MAVCGDEFMRYDGRAKIVKDAALLAKVRAALPKIMSLYDKNGWEMGIFYLENGHAEIRGMMDLKEEFDVYKRRGNEAVKVRNKISMKYLEYHSKTSSVL